MGLKTHPQARVSVDGAPVRSLFYSRLVTLSITDREGIQSDTLEVKLDDAFPHFDAPRRGAIATVQIDGVNVGAFVIDRVEYACRPYVISVKGHSADLRSDMKTSKSRHWDNVSVGALVEEIAAEYELATQISPVVSTYVYPWIGQQDESDLQFLERVAKRHGALFTIKNGVLLWLERGVGQTADGTEIPTALIGVRDLVEGSCRVAETDVERFASVKAYWHDGAGAKRQSVVVEADPEAKGEHVLRDPYGSKEEAEAAAAAAAREMTRGAIALSCAVVGRAELIAGQPVALAGVRPGLDGKVFILETVQHSYSKSGGLRTTLAAKLKADA